MLIFDAYLLKVKDLFYLFAEYYWIVLVNRLNSR